ncbi:MAG: roadblock/LC7 domain-containing protein [Candidatus Hermodarchaeota archaeon]
MVELELSKAEKVKRLTQLIAEIKKAGSLLGILFAYRDGGLIAKDFKEDIDFDNFTSMCASVLESAIGLSRAMGDRKAVKIITELGTQTIVIIECDEKTFLAFDLNYESDFNIILEKMEEYIRKVIFLY